MDNAVSMSKKLTREEVSDQASGSGSHDRLIEDVEKLRIVVHKCVKSTPINGDMKHKFDSLKMAVASHQSSQPKIRKVPFVLRANEKLKECYVPRMFSFGPIHHGDPNLKLAETLKLTLAGQFIRECGVGVEILYDKTREELKNLKECYDDEEIRNVNDEDLAWIFLVDGCAILKFIDCYVQEDQGNRFKKLNIKSDQIAFAQQDMLLLENQVPYKLLKLLISSSVDNHKKGESINKFIDMIIDEIRGSRRERKTAGAQPTHLLELLRERFVVEPTAGVTKQPAEEAKPPVPAPAATKATTAGTSKSMTDATKATKSDAEKTPADNVVGDWHSFRNVQELKASGIKLKCNEKKTLTKISFTPKLYGGILELHPLVVDDSTGPKFLNMIAYEMCPDFDNDFEVTSYISFLDSLIDHPQDVKELRDAEILHNFLGSDEEVAKLFNKISTDLVPNPEQYREVKRLIQKHYDRKWNTWIAEGIHTHFESPWTLLAFIGAIIALVLSFVQTWYTIYPV